MRQTLFGCQIDNLTMSETLDRIADMVATDRPHQHVVLNVDKVVKAASDPELTRIIAACDLISADGMPLVWASRLLGQPLKERVTGVDLFFALLVRAEERGWGVFFLGARATVLSEVVRRASAMHPSLRIAGHRDGYWSPEQEQAVVDTIRRSAPQVLFVAISSPAKERFLARYQSEMRVPFAMGVGGTFDVMAGVVSRAPRWMQRAGFEWFYRFLQEPRRMFRRYFIDDMRFFGMLGSALLDRVAAGRRQVGQTAASDVSDRTICGAWSDSRVRTAHLAAE